MKALVYLRVSTEEQVEKGYSIPAQRTECINKAVELGCRQENIHIFSDEGVSGAVLERPQLMAALDMLKKEAGKIHFFICYDSSRLSRNASHQLIIIDEIKKSNAKIVFLKNSYQDSAEGRFQLTVMAAVDEYERARLKLRTEMGKRAKANQHKLTHNPGLYGYDFDPITDTLTRNEENAKSLKNIYKMLIDEHLGPAEIAERLNASEVPSPRMKQWSRVTVRRILSNPSYLGKLYIRRYDARDYHMNKYKKKGEKNKVKERPRDEWVAIAIPQLIDEETWKKAQNILKKTSRMRKNTEKAQFLLYPLLRCGICGGIMNGKSITRGKFSYRYYICSNKYKGIKETRCEAVMLRADDMEKEVWDYVSRSISFFINQKIDLEKVLDKYLIEKENDIKNNIIKREKAKSEKQRILTLYQKGYINEDEMRIKLTDNERRMGSINVAVTSKNKHYEDFKEKIKSFRISGSLPYIIENILTNLKCEERKHIIRLLVSEIIVKGNTISIKGWLGGFLKDTTLVGDVPESYITVPEAEMPNLIQTPDPFDSN